LTYYQLLVVFDTERCTFSLELGRRQFLQNHALIFFGSPGCGKDENSTVATPMGYQVVNMGPLLKSSAPPEIMSRVMKGGLAPDDLVHDLATLHTPEPHRDLKVLYNGVPRSLVQSQRLVQMLTNLYQMPMTTIFFAVDEEVALKRLLSRGREDDRKEVALNRLHVYELYAHEVITHLKKTTRVIQIDANQDLELVRASVKEAIEEELGRLSVPTTKTPWWAHTYEGGLQTA